MAPDSWLEPRTRIPFVGILAIVIIVIVVAVFVKTQLGPLFPPSDVHVQSASEAPIATGRASSSFIGLREIALREKELLQGVLNTGSGARTFIIDTQGRLLIIDDSKTQEEILLKPSESDPGTLTAQFDYKNQQTRVDIDPIDAALRYSEPGKSVTPIMLGLGTLVTYEGTFRFRNEQYLFQFSPSSSEAVITGATPAVVPLVKDGHADSGTWQDGPNNRPVSINIATMQAVIEEVY
jgi:hypothetical protein